MSRTSRPVYRVTAEAIALRLIEAPTLTAAEGIGHNLVLFLRSTPSKVRPMTAAAAAMYTRDVVTARPGASPDHTAAMAAAFTSAVDAALATGGAR